MVKQERLRVKEKSWVEERVEEALANLEEMDFDVPTSTVEGQRQYIRLMFTPWLWLDSVYGATQTGGNPNSFAAIYQNALYAVSGILNDASISISIDGFKVDQTTRNIEVTMTVNEENITWSTGEDTTAKHAFPNLIINQTEGHTEEVVQILIANAEDLLSAGYQMMEDVYGYGEQ